MVTAVRNGMTPFAWSSPLTIGEMAASAPLPMITVSRGTSANMATLFSQPSNSPRVPSNSASTMNTGPMMSRAASARRQTTSTPTVPSNMIKAPSDRRLAGEASAGVAAATAGFLVQAAVRSTPVVLDGVFSLAAALVARDIAPDAARWWLAGHRSTEPAQSVALTALGLEPILDLGLRLGEGSGAVQAVPVLRAARAVLADMGSLADLT